MLDAGAQRGAKSEPFAVFVRTPKEKIFVGLADMVRPHGREGGEGSETADDDPNAANAQPYDDTVRKVFDQLGIEWKVIEERIIAVVSDGAGTMGAYVGLLNDIREKGGKELIGWVKDAAHCPMRAISTAKGKVKLWYHALDDLVSFLACFHETSSKRMQGLWRKGGKFCFSRRTGARWVEAIFHELDIVLENLPAVLEHLSDYISHEADLGRWEKAQGLFDAVSHPLFKFTAAFFCDIFAVVCATSKKVQATKGARVAAIQGLMNVMCTHLLHTMRHVIPGAWEESLGVDVGSSIIKGSRMKFLCTLVEGVQTRFRGTEWDDSANLEDSVEASWCSCERLFSYVTATDFGQSTEPMCETLWVTCNGEAPEDWRPFEVFGDLRKIPFRPRKRKQGHAFEVEGGGLLGFAAFKDLASSFEEDGEAEVQLDIQDSWVVPKRATRDADIGDVYGVGLQGEDEDSEDEDLEQEGAVASSSSFDLRKPSVVRSTSSNPATQLTLRYDVDEAVLKAMERGRLHQWNKVEFKAISRKHGLRVSGGKGELMERVRVHFQRLYQL